MKLLKKEKQEIKINFLHLAWKFQKLSTFASLLQKGKEFFKKNGPVVQLVRIHACHAWGRGFESRPDR
jgi:hypothetical protein